MVDKGTKRKRDEDLPRVTYNAGSRTFDRLLKEESLEAMKNVVRKKLGWSNDVSLQLAQLREGRTVDLEDDDDFEAFCSAAHTLPLIVVQVTSSSLKSHSKQTSYQPSVNFSSPPVPPTPKKRKKIRKLDAAETVNESPDKSSKKRKARIVDESKAPGPEQPQREDNDDVQRPKKKKKTDSSKDAATSVDASKDVFPAESAADNTVTLAADASKSKESKKDKKKKAMATVDEPAPKDADNDLPAASRRQPVVEADAPALKDTSADVSVEKPKKRKKKRASDKAQDDERHSAYEPAAEAEKVAAKENEEEQEPAQENSPSPATEEGTDKSKENGVAQDQKKKRKKKEKDTGTVVAEALARAAALNEQVEAEEEAAPEAQKIDKGPAEQNQEDAPAGKSKSKTDRSKQTKDLSGAAVISPEDHQQPITTAPQPTKPTAPASKALATTKSKAKAAEPPNEDIGPEDTHGEDVAPAPAEKPTKPLSKAPAPKSKTTASMVKIAEPLSKAPAAKEKTAEAPSKAAAKVKTADKTNEPVSGAPATKETIKPISKASAVKLKRRNATTQCPICLAVDSKGKIHVRSRCPSFRASNPHALRKRLAELEKEEEEAVEDEDRTEVMEWIKAKIAEKESKTAAKKGKTESLTIAPNSAAPAKPATSQNKEPSSKPASENSSSKEATCRVEKSTPDPEYTSPATSPAPSPVQKYSARIVSPDDSISVALSSNQKKRTVGQADSAPKSISRSQEYDNESSSDKSDSAFLRISAVSLSHIATSSLDDQLEALMRGPSGVRANQIASSESEEAEDEELLEEEEEEPPPRYQRFSIAQQHGDSSDEAESEPSDKDDSSRAVTAPPIISASRRLKTPESSDGEEQEEEDSKGERSFHEVNEDTSSVDIDASGDRAVSQALAQDTEVFRLSTPEKPARGSDTEDSDDENEALQENTVATLEDSEDERSADPDADQEEEDAPSPEESTAIPQDERHGDPEADEDDLSSPKDTGANLETDQPGTPQDSEGERNADPNADEPASEDEGEPQPPVKSQPAPTTPKRSIRRELQESIDQFETPVSPTSPIANFGKDTVHSTFRVVDKMKDRTGRTPQPTPMGATSSMEKAMKLLESVKFAKRSASSQKAASATQKTPATRTRASVRLASQPPPNTPAAEPDKPAIRAVRGRKPASQVVEVAEEATEPPKTNGRVTRGRKAATSQAVQIVEETPPPRRSRRKTKQPDAAPVEEAEAEEAQEEPKASMSMDNWEVLKDDSAAPDVDPTIMVDELESDAPEQMNDSSQKPLFLDSETVPGFPFSQWTDTNPKPTSDSSDEEEIKRAIMRQPRPAQRASQAFRRLTDIASQDIPQFHSAVRPAKASNDKPKPSEWELFGQPSDDSESSDSDSSDSDEDKRKSSHIPKARRAGKSKV